MLQRLGQGIIVLKALLVMLILVTGLFAVYKMSTDKGLCIGSIEDAEGLYSSSSRDGRWTEINKYRSDIVTCYKMMNK